jgi:hypothetical protein
MTELPKDPVMLLSFVNTQLRDFYSSLDEFCAVCCCDKEKVVETLGSIDYQYEETLNKFI